MMSELYWYVKWCSIGLVFGFCVGYGVGTWLL